MHDLIDTAYTQVALMQRYRGSGFRTLAYLSVNSMGAGFMFVRKNVLSFIRLIFLLPAFCLCCNIRQGPPQRLFTLGFFNLTHLLTADTLLLLSSGAPTLFTLDFFNVTLLYFF
jgi:hypothetical protein